MYESSGVDCSGCQGLAQLDPPRQRDPQTDLCVPQGCMIYPDKDIDSSQDSRQNVGALASSFQCMVACSGQATCRGWAYTSNPRSCELTNATSIKFVVSVSTIANNSARMVSGLRCPGATI